MDLKDENYNSSNSNSEDNNDEEIKCRCGQNVDSGSLMICCDKCEFWQHAECYFGITKQKMPETFYCHLCVPKQADMFKYIENEDIKNELLNDWLEYAKKNKKKRKKKKNQEDYNFNTKEVAVLERYWKHYCRNAHNEDLSENILRAVAIIFNCKVAIIHEVFYNMALDIQQLSSPSFIIGTDNKDPFSGWKLKNENIYTKVSDNITKPKEISDPHSLDNPLEDFMKVVKVEMWEEKKDQNDQWYLEYGVFTNKAIDQSQLIIEFYGKFTTWDAYRNLKGKLTKPNFRGLIFPEKGLCVDATKHGNVSRYLRRSCSPNSKVIEKWIDGKMRLGIFSTCKIEAGNEITIPFDYSYGSLRNGLECACTKEQCPVLLWYIDRKRLSDTFLECNKLEAIVKEKEPKIVVEQQPIPKKKVIIDLQVEVAPTPIPHETRSRSKSRRNSSKMSREERKLQAIVQTIDRLEEQEKKKQSPLSIHLSQRTSLKTSTNSMAKKSLFPSNNTNYRETSPKAHSNLLNRKPLSHSSQNVNGSILNRSKSPSHSNSTSRTTPPKSQIKKELKESSEVVVPKMVGKKAWMTKYLTEENESKSEEANQSPNHMQDDSPSSSPIDKQNTENNNNFQYKQGEIKENIIISINNNHPTIHSIHHDNNNPPTIHSINNNNININVNEKIENNININTVNNNNTNTQQSIQIHNIQIQQPPIKNEIVPPPHFKFHTHPSQSSNYVPPPSINESIQENGSSNKRKLEESNGSHLHFITETLNNNNNNNNNLILNNPVTLPLPPNSPPASPPDIGPELPPDPKKRRNSNNTTNGDNLNVNSHQNEPKLNDNILPPSNQTPSQVPQESYPKENPNFVNINGNNGNSFINGNGYVDRQPNGIYNNNPSQGNNNFPIDSIKNN